MTKTVIIGAGLAGLLAANMLRRNDTIVHEAQKALPNNHHAVLRFRTDKVALQTGIPFRKVPVFKAIHKPVNPVADALAYSAKVLGRIEMRSVIHTAPVDRFIAPTDLISRMAEDCRIEYGSPADNDAISSYTRQGYGVISTMPMPMLMDVLGWEGLRPTFNYRAGSVIKAQLHNCDVFASIYFPHGLECYRASITGSELTIEIAGPVPGNTYNLIGQVLMAFGLNQCDIDPESIQSHTQPYAKLARLSDTDLRLSRDFMFWATTTRGVYSLGRFATWRAGLLMDDVVDDVSKIEGWMRSSPYNLRKDT